MTLGAIDPGVAGLLTAIGAFLAALAKIFLDWRKDRAAAKEQAQKDSQLVRRDTLANYLEGYQRLVDQLQEENARLLKRVALLEEKVAILEQSRPRRSRAGPGGPTPSSI